MPYQPRDQAVAATLDLWASGMTPRQVAEVLGIDLQTVHGRVKRARCGGWERARPSREYWSPADWCRTLRVISAGMTPTITLVAHVADRDRTTTKSALMRCVALGLARLTRPPSGGRAHGFELTRKGRQLAAAAVSPRSR